MIGSHCRWLALVCGSAISFGALAQNQVANWESPHVSPLALTPNGTRLLAVNTADQRLEVFARAADGTLSALGAVAVGVEPVSVRVRDDGEAWVVNHLSDSISIVDLASLRVTRTLRTGDEPTDVVFAGTPRRAFVSISQRNRIEVYDPGNLAAAPQQLPIEGEEPRALAVSPDGARVYVAFFESGNATTAVLQQNVSAPGGPYGGVNPPPNSGNAFSPPLAPGLPPGPPVAQIVRRDANGIWRDGNARDWSPFVTWNLHDHDLAAIDANTLGVAYTNSLMTSLMALGVKPDGRIAAVGTEALNEIRFEPNVQSIFIRVRIASIDAAGANRQIADLNPQLDYNVRTLPAAAREASIGDPRGIVWHPTQNRAYITGMGSNNVIVSDASGARIARVDVGQGPTGVVLDASGANLYVLNHFDASISRIATTTNTESARIAFFDPTPAAIRDGRPLLYDTHTTSGLGQASCASCHIDARSDFLAWDLGNPQGAVKIVDQPCRQGQTCRPWHPMKGPMVTQSLQGIIGNEPLHWRGDKRDLADFAPAYVGLQGIETEPDAAAMARFETFLLNVRYPPNPNRNVDGSMPATITTSSGPGDPASGLTLYRTIPVLAGGATCENCHALPVGTSGEIDDPMLALAPQSMKQSQLRGLYEKTGWLRTSQNNAKGFGFNHHSEFDTLNALLLAGFNFGAPTVAVQRRRDVEAFLLVFDSETHAAVGQQLQFDGSNNTNAADVARLASFVALADAGTVGLIAKGTQGGLARGWTYATQSTFVSDREHVFTTPDVLRTGATAGNEIVFTVVAPFTQYRMGVDRDADGWFDGDELDHASDPNSATSIPAAFCKPDFDTNGTLDANDQAAFALAFQNASVRANYDHSLGTNGLPSVDAADQGAFNAAFAAGCEETTSLFANGFE